MSENKTYCGFVAIVGRSNVGKSTLLNKLLGRKVSITSCKPQTTRQPIIGIHTDGPYQAIYVDTPGLRFEEKLAMNLLLNRATGSYIYDVELVIFVVEGTHWTSDDKIVVQKLRQINCLVVLAINKVDNVTDKRQLLPHIQFLSQQMSFYDIVPICAKNGMNIKLLTAIIRTVLPHNVHYFPQYYITGSSQRDIAAENIREKLMRFLGDELPYSVRVEIEHFAAKNCGVYDIHGIILVNKESQKKIIIGNKGSKIKTIGIKARQDMEYIFDKPVHLKLWVKVKSSNERARHILEYTYT